MEYLTDTGTFMRRTGVISDYDELFALGLFHDSILGGFYRDNVDELRMFCSQHPEYHIVSVVNANCYLNRFAPGAVSFYLADGDTNKRLVLTAPSLVPKFRAA